jgi:hypothetical protein
MFDAFTRNIPSSGIVAVFISIKNNRNFDKIKSKQVQISKSQEIDQYIFDYMNLAEFKKFIF